MDLQNAHSKYSPNCSRRQRALLIKGDKSNDAERSGRIIDEFESEFVDEVEI